MNARQKAKEYKRKYIALMNRFIKSHHVELHHVELHGKQYKIDTVRFERFYPAPLIDGHYSMHLHSYLQKTIGEDIAQWLVNDHGKYIDFHIEFCPDINRYRLYGEIKVVNKEER